MNILLYIALFICWFTLITCEIITSTILLSGGISSLGAYYYQYIHCKYNECCTDDYINPDLEKLDNLLTKNLYGQHIAHKTIMNALKGYLNQNEQTKKALSLSFHGTPGTGKNYVAKFIAESLFKRGPESKYFHYYNGRTHFPLEKEIKKYQAQLHSNIKEALEACPQSLFVFDEIDKMPEGILNALVPFLDYYTWAIKENTNRAIFIFLSNTGSRQIVQQLLSLWEKGIKREDTKLQDFENLIAIGAFNEKGGYHLSDTIETSVIDHYIPFLPLEEEHIRKCAESAFLKKGVNPTNKMIEDALSHMTFDPPPHNLYSRSGCKRIEQKVTTIVYSYKM